MIRSFLVVFYLLYGGCAVAQYTPSHVFAHNDYVREKPFYTAYELGVGYIEADVFLVDGDLMVAHHKHEIVKNRTLDNLYLKPLKHAIAKNNGVVYPDARRILTLMIDLKTEGVSTLDAVVARLKEYPQLTSCSTLRFLISGSVPDPAKWKAYPPYIYFDGRPGTAYTEDQLDRIAMISTGFQQHIQWDGRRELSSDERDQIRAFVDDAHQKGKAFRFWATPDFPQAWKVLIALDLDVIVTDDVAALVSFLAGP